MVTSCKNVHYWQNPSGRSHGDCVRRSFENMVYMTSPRAHACRPNIVNMRLQISFMQLTNVVLLFPYFAAQVAMYLTVPSALLSLHV